MKLNSLEGLTFFLHGKFCTEPHDGYCDYNKGKYSRNYNHWLNVAKQVQKTCELYNVDLLHGIYIIGCVVPYGFTSFPD